MLTSRILKALSLWPAQAGILAKILNHERHAVAATLNNLRRDGKVRIISTNPNVYEFVTFGNTPNVSEDFEIDDLQDPAPAWDEIDWWLRWKAYWQDWDKIKARLDAEREKRIHAFTRFDYEALN